ncbi:MAG: ATP12 family chaperone protein [Alphaproteobacteria bacterium]|nr:ATP12 family chaperone protein [Alphaproteobacteria bacterium]
MKRFYKSADILRSGGQWQIVLDGKPVRTPLKNRLATAHESLARAVANEWAEQGEHINLAAMTLTQLLNTRIDQAATSRTRWQKEVMRYLDTDLLCYRAPAEGSATGTGIAAHQAALWDPWLDWFHKTYGHRLQTTQDIKALRQSPQAHQAVGRDIETCDDDRLMLLQTVVPLAGSLVLGLAFVKGAVDDQALYDAMRAEEIFKARLYGDAMSDESARADLAAAQCYRDCLP